MHCGGRLIGWADDTRTESLRLAIGWNLRHIVRMNYSRIYRAFIADRQQKQEISRLGYFERHHIIPRSLGGSDDDGNLIDLTPEDHFFAHLLLARIHGGYMWSALFLMGGDRWGARKGLGLRGAYGMARREWSDFARTIEGKKGVENARYDHERYEWINLDTGEKRFATKGEMWASEGGCRPHWTSVVSGERNSMLGWCLVGKEPRIRGGKNKVFDFVNVNGRTFMGTQKQFCEMSGASIATASRITRHGAVSVNGWKLHGNDRMHHNLANDGSGKKLGCGKDYAISKNGFSFVGKAHECANIIGVARPQFFSGAHLAINSGKTYKGWTVSNA